MARFLSVLIGAAFVAFGAGAALGDDGRELVGFAGPAVDGSGGIIEKHAMCDAAFPGSRVCRTTDILDNGARDNLAPLGEAWIRPNIVAANVDTGRLLDDSGNSLVDYLGGGTCGGWALSSGAVYGTTVYISELGVFFREDTCNNTHEVACCAARKGRQ